MFQAEIFLQENGTAMGSPVSPLMAKLYMKWFEQHALRTSPSLVCFFFFFLQVCVDDTFDVIQEEQVDAFTTHINNISIQDRIWILVLNLVGVL